MTKLNILPLIWTLIGLYSIHLSIKCNNGINLIHLVLAFCLGPIYAAFMLATSSKKCL